MQDKHASIPTPVNLTPCPPRRIICAIPPVLVRVDAQPFSWLLARDNDITAMNTTNDDISCVQQLWLFILVVAYALGFAVLAGTLTATGHCRGMLMRHLTLWLQPRQRRASFKASKLTHLCRPSQQVSPVVCHPRTNAIVG